MESANEKLALFHSKHDSSRKNAVFIFPFYANDSCS